MAMASGHELYREIFHSQPPAFILGVYPFFLAGGGNLWAARLGVVVWSLVALPAAAVVGGCVGGRSAALLALGLIAFDPFFLTQSRTLDAEAPQIAFALLAVAAALLWARAVKSRAAPAWALLAGAAATVATLCKLSGIATFIPLLIIAANAALDRKERRTVSLAVLTALLGAVAVLAAFGLPFLGDFQLLWQQVVEFHLAARQVFHDGPTVHAGVILNFLVAAPVSYAALFGAVIGIARRDPLVLPMLGWFLAIVAMLVNQTPLFDHHLVLLQPSLVALATLGFSRRRPDARLPLRLIATILCLAVVAYDVTAALSYVSRWSHRSAGAERNRAIAQSLARAGDDSGLIITDCQLHAALAQRRTPPWLVDTSYVRIFSGYLTATDLIAAAARPDAGMVLFCGAQLDVPQLAPFRLWVAQHFQLLHDDPRTAVVIPRLWIKPPAPAAR